jgi:hypothetical protein
MSSWSRNPEMPIERHLSGPLLLGMLTAPALFVWFFLRSGYPASLRRAAFTFTIITTAIAIAGRTLGGP